jgi:hypothetical protein
VEKNMRHSCRIWTCNALAIVFFVFAAGIVAALCSDESTVLAQPPAKDQLPAGLQFVPTDAALFVYADVEKIWQNPIFQSIRRSDAKLFDDFSAISKAEVGLTPENLKTVVAFVPSIKNPRQTESLGLVLTFNKAFDKDKFAAGVQKVFRSPDQVKTISVGEQTVVILFDLGEEFAKPRAFDQTGPLATAIKEAASGKHPVYAGSNLANLPDILHGDNLPDELRAYQPLFKALTITGSLDIGKTIDIDVRVKTATAGQAIDCEKSLGALLTLIQETIGGAIKEVSSDSADGRIKDLVTVMKAGIATAKNAKLSTLGNEVNLTASIPTDLPIVSAYLSAKEKAEAGAVRVQSLNNLKQIALAMHNYHDTYNAFPPAAVCDKKGNPQLSWRVLILPFIEQEELYKEFKLDEPWDSAHNKKLLAKMPKLYALPGKSKDGATDTYYRVFVGNGAGFDWISGTKITSITDGTSNTFLCVTAATSVPWTKPDELEFDPEKDMTKLIGLMAGGTCQAAYFDGSVHSFNKIPDKTTLNAYITKAGGEVIPENP